MKSDIFSEFIKLIVSALYDKVEVNYMSSLSSKDVFINIEWKNIVLLDACRYDALRFVIEKTFPSMVSNVKPIISNASSTPEFVREIILNNSEVFRDVVYVSANPMVDITLKGFGTTPEKIFYKYVPAWKFIWHDCYGTVLPKDLYKFTLKVFIKYPSKKMIIHFLQPHFPFISYQYNHINKLLHDDIQRMFRFNSLNEGIRTHTNILLIAKLFRIFLSCGMISSVLSSKYCKYIRRNINEFMKAYVINLIKVLPYVRKLSKILPGKIIITSDHGESLGEFIHPTIPIRLLGHISRIRTPSLITVPLIEIDNNFSLSYGLKKALKERVKHLRF